MSKKYYIGFSTFVLTLLPLNVVISCGSSSSEDKDKDQFNGWIAKVLQVKPNRIADGSIDEATLKKILGITLPGRISGVRREYTITTNDEGVATVIITFIASNGAKRTTKFQIIRFKSLEETANAKVAIDKTLFATFNNQRVIDKPNQIADGLISKVVLNNMPGITLPVETSGVTREYKITTNDLGVATVTVTFSTPGGAKISTTFKIAGFKTLQESNDEIASDRALFVTFNNQRVTGKPNQIADGSINKVVLNNLPGITLPVETSGVTREYKITTNDLGVATVTVTFSMSGGANASTTFKITGFKTLQESNAKITIDKTLFATFNNQRVAGKPNQIADGLISKVVLNNLPGITLPVETSGVTREYKITTNDLGVATVTVTFSTPGGANISTTFKITGFKTLQESNDEIASDRALFVTFNNQRVTGKPNQIADGSINKVVLNNLPGITLPVETSGVKREYRITTNDLGVATVTVTFSTPGGANISTTFKITGFKTLKERVDTKILIDKNLFSTLKQQIVNGQPDPIANGSINKVVLNNLPGITLPAETSGVKREYRITTNDLGIATVTVTFSMSGGTNASTTFKITGFKTLQESNAKIAIDKTLFATFSNQRVTGKPNQIADGSINKVVLNNLPGITLPAETSGVKREYRITTNDLGVAIVTVTFSKPGGTNASTTFKITGFKTLQESNDEIASDRALFVTFSNQRVIGKPNQIADGSINKVVLNNLPGITLPAENSGVKREYRITTNDLGVAIITVTFSKLGGTNASTTFKITGFKTLKEQFDTKILIDKNLFSTLKRQIVKSQPDQIADGSINKVVLDNLPGITLPAETSGVKRKYTIATSFQGVATVTVIFPTLDGTKQTTTFQITGFKNKQKTQNFQVKLDQLKFRSFNPVISNKPNQIADGTIDEATLNALDSQWNLPKKSPSVSRMYKIVTSDEGIATVTVNFNAEDSETKTTTFIITGFKNKEDIEKENIKRELNLSNGVLSLIRDDDSLKDKTSTEAMDYDSYYTFSSKKFNVRIDPPSIPTISQNINVEFISATPGINKITYAYRLRAGEVKSIIKKIDLNGFKPLKELNKANIKAKIKEWLGGSWHRTIGREFYLKDEEIPTSLWPKKLKNINWRNLIGLNPKNTLFKGNLAEKNINGAWGLEGIDVSKVKVWPRNLQSIDWKGIKLGPNGEANPFVGDLSSFEIYISKLDGVDVSRVSRWPKKLTSVNWKNVRGLSVSTPFKGDFSDYQITGSILDGVDISRVTKWPSGYVGLVEWKNVIYTSGQEFLGLTQEEKNLIRKNGRESNFQIEFSKFKNADSMKQKIAIDTILQTKNKNDVLNNNDLLAIGYIAPSLSPGFSATYTLEEIWTNSVPKVKIKVTLAKGTQSGIKIITISTNFKTPEEIAANTKITTDKNKFAPFSSIALNNKANRIVDGIVSETTFNTFSEITLPDTIPGVTRKYKISTNSLGVATVTVTFSAPSGINQNATFQITGFKNLSGAC